MRLVQELVRGAHVDEERVAASALRQGSRVEHGDARGLLDVRVVGVEELEQPGTEVIAADRDVAEALTQLVGEDEASVDDLALFAVAKRVAVAVVTDRILDVADHRHERTQLLVGELCAQSHADDCTLPEHFAKPVGHVGI